MKIKLWVGVLVCAILVGNAHAQRDYSKVVIKATKLAGNVHMLEGSGGNIGVSVGDDGVLIIDDQFAPLADKIRAAIGNLGGSDPAFVLNTHHHGDHTGGNAIFGEKAVIVAHENVRKRLSAYRRNDEALPHAALPEVTYKDGVTIHFNGEAISVVHFPTSHTDGDGVVFFKGSKVVHTGDLFFKDRFPYIDLGSGGSVAGAIQSVAKLMKMIPEDWKIIPGHGSLATRADLQTYLTMLEKTSGVVRDRMKKGKTLTECQKAGLPEAYSGWGGGFISSDRWVEIIFNSYK